MIEKGFFSLFNNFNCDEETAAQQILLRLDQILPALVYWIWGLHQDALYSLYPFAFFILSLLLDILFLLSSAVKFW